MEQDWFDQITTPAQRPQAGPARPVQSAPQPQGMVIKAAPQPTQMEQQRLAMDQERLAMARQEQARANQRMMQGDIPSGFRMGANGALEPIPGGPADRNAPQQDKITESERTAGFLATRVADELKVLKQIGQSNPSALSPSFGAEAVRSVFGDTAANYLTDADRQRVEASQLNLLDAALTLGTGAAYTREQLEGYRRSYFPMLGDSESTVREKQARLDTLLNAAKIKAGRASGAIDEALGVVAPTAAQQPAQPKLSPEQYDAAIGRMIREGRSADEIMQFARDSGYTITNPEAVQRAVAGAPTQMQTEPSMLSEIGRGLSMGTGAIVEGAGDLIGLVANPLNTALNATGIPQALTGQELSTDIGASLRDDFGLARPQNDFERTIDAANQFGAQALTGIGIAGRIAGAPASIAGPGGGGGGVMRSVASQLAARPGLDTAAAATSGASTEVARQRGAGPVGQTLAGIAGGATALAGGSTLNALMTPRTASPIAQAAARQGVDLLPADVGGATTRRVSNAAIQAPVSGEPIIAAGQRQQAQMGDAVRRAGNDAAMPVEQAGEAVRAAGKLYVKNETARIGRLYDRARDAARGVTIKPLATVQKIDGQIAQLSELQSTNAPLIATLSKLKGDIEGGVSVNGLRDARTALSQGVYDGKLRSNQEKALLHDVIETLSTDIEGGLRQAGRTGAAETFKRADALWKARIEQIDEVLEPIIGASKSGEDIVAAVESMTRGQRGGSQRLRRLMAELPEEQALGIRATIAERLGRATAGAQDDTGQVFSPSTFLTNWNKMTPAGKAALFADQEMRRNLDDIAKIAAGTKEGQRFANTSNTAGGIYGNIGAGVGAAVLSPLAAVLGLGAQYMTGRLMASPAFARWLAKIPANPSPQAASNYLGRLSVVASREPAIANNVQLLQQRLSEAMAGAPMRAAASGPSAGDNVTDRPE